MKSHEVESKASRETVRRLVADVDHEQKVSVIRASDLNSVRQVYLHLFYGSVTITILINTCFLQPLQIHSFPVLFPRNLIAFY